jgi:hypothetical protein
MDETVVILHPPVSAKAHSSVRALANQAFSRTASAPLIPGNSIRLLNDAGELSHRNRNRISGVPNCA